MNRCSCRTDLAENSLMSAGKLQRFFYLSLTIKEVELRTVPDRPC